MRPDELTRDMLPPIVRQHKAPPFNYLSMWVVIAVMFVGVFSIFFSNGRNVEMFLEQQIHKAMGQ